MKLIDEKGKLFGIINILDLFVLVILVALIGFGAQKVLKVNPGASVTTQKAVMKYLVQEVRDVTVNAIIEDDIVKDFDKNSVYGKVIKKEVSPAKRLVQAADGKILESTVPNRYDVMIYIEGEAVVSKTGVTMGNQEVRVGWNPAIKGKTYTTKGVIYDIILQ